MVHQLSLTLSIPHSKYLQTVSTLQALTGLLLPQPIGTYTLLTKPHNVFRPKFEPGKVNQIEQYYMKCTTSWADSKGEPVDLDIAVPVPAPLAVAVVSADKMFGGHDIDAAPVKHTWTLLIADIPVAGKNVLCSAQNIYESTLVHAHTVATEAATVHQNTVPDGAGPSSGPEQTQDKMDLENDIQVKDEHGKDKTMVNDEHDKDKTTVNDEHGKDKTTVNDEHDKDERDKETVAKTTPQTDTVRPDEGMPEYMDVDEFMSGGDQPQRAHVSDSEVVAVDSADDMMVDDSAGARTRRSKTAERRRDLSLTFLEELGYDVINQYWTKGVRFFYGDVIIEIYKVFVRDDDLPSSDSSLPLRLLDVTNTFQVKVYINVNKATDVEVISAGIKQLQKLKDLLKSLFVLEIPDRSCMDMRVKK